MSKGMMLWGILRQALARASRGNTRRVSTSARKDKKVAVLGASGGIGQPLSLLLKSSRLITKLALCDVVNSAGVAADVSHIDTNVPVQGFDGAEELKDALKGADLVLMPAGMPRKPGMTRDDLFEKNASIVRDLTLAIANACPEAFIAIITNPVNSTVPIASEVLKSKGVLNPKKVFGVTTLDIVRASTFVGQAKCLDPSKIKVPVIGGHSGNTIIPLLSQIQPSVAFTPDDRKEITKRIQEGGTEVVEAKAGLGSATLSMAYAGYRFATSLLRALHGAGNVVECTYIRSDVTCARYFSTPVLIGPCGVERNLGMGKMCNFEKELLEVALPEIVKNIKTGEEFIKQK